MNNNKAIKDRDIIGICWYLINYCETYININTVSTEHASAFHSFLPTLLTYIFGSPTTRGWLQTDTRPEQDDAIRQLLDPRGHFLTALLKLGTRPEYCYDMTTEKFPDDIRRALAAGAIEYLPRVYDNCAFLDNSMATASVDLRSAATRQSSIFPRPSIGEFRIRFNMIQFYMYYFASVPIWPPLTPSSSPPTTISYTTTSSSTSTGPISYHGKTPYSARPNTSYSKPSPQVLSSNTANNNNLPYLVPGQLRSLNASVYNKILQLYMRAYIPCVVNDSASYVNGVGTFFLDALIELWIRTIWISTSQKLSLEFIQCLATFLKYVVGGDLRRCTSHQNTNRNKNLNNINHGILGESAYTNLYRSIKDELYLLLSRLSTNWRRQDDYIWVLNLWTLWAAPWRFGKDPIILSADSLQQGNIYQPLEKESSSSSSASASPQLTGISESSSTSPLELGWGVFILENAWYYITLVDSFLQRISTFTYPDKSLPPASSTASSYMSSSGSSQLLSPTPSQPTYLKATTTLPSTTVIRSSHPLEGNSLYGELNILQQLMNVWKSKLLVEYLAQIEDGLEVTDQKLTLSVISPPGNTTTKTLKTSTSSSIYQPSAFLQSTKTKFSSALSSITATGRQQHQHQKSDNDLLGNISSICYMADRSNTDMVMQQLERLRNQILSVSGTTTTHSQQWKSSNIYSRERQPPPGHLIKLLYSLHGAMETRTHSAEHPTWKNSMLGGGGGGQKKMTPTTSKDAATLSTTLTDLVLLLKLPFPDGSQTSMSTQPSTYQGSSGISTPTTLTNRHISSSTSSVSKPQQPIWSTSRRERPKVPPLGPRVDTTVRSYENKFLLRLVLSFERRVNSLYYRLRIPYVVYTPDHISFRWVAAPVNLVYLFIILLLIYFILRPSSPLQSL